VVSTGGGLEVIEGKGKIVENSCDWTFAKKSESGAKWSFSGFEVAICGDNYLATRATSRRLLQFD